MTAFIIEEKIFGEVTKTLAIDEQNVSEITVTLKGQDSFATLSSKIDSQNYLAGLDGSVPCTFHYVIDPKNLQVKFMSGCRLELRSCKSTDEIDSLPYIGNAFYLVFVEDRTQWCFFTKDDKGDVIDFIADLVKQYPLLQKVSDKLKGKTFQEVNNMTADEKAKIVQEIQKGLQRSPMGDLLQAMKFLFDYGFISDAVVKEMNDYYGNVVEKTQSADLKQDVKLFIDGMQHCISNENVVPIGGLSYSR
jgi:hypothetical protein